MKRALTRLAWAVLLTSSNVVSTGLSHVPVVAAEPGQQAGAGQVWTLVINIATKPEGEVGNLTLDATSTVRTIDSLTAVKDVVIGADGTFKFEGCDFGFVHSDLIAKMARGDMHIVNNLQPLVRGRGKWNPAANGEDESLTLRLEYS